MGMIRTTALRSRPTMLGQLGLSVTATVAAALVMAGARYEIAAFRSVAPVPEVTSGGKFSARAEVPELGLDEAVPVGVAVPRIPLMAADAALQAMPMFFATEDRATPADPIGGSKKIVHAGPRRRPLTEAATDVLPPKRSDVLASGTTQVVVESSGIETLEPWSVAKGFYRQALWLGKATFDHVNPMNLLP